jgi:dinuclear metal center YbgI/SA1388 family protein
MTTVRDLCDAMESIAPSRFAAEWDNVGLLVGDPRASVARAMLTVDLTREVYSEARALGADAVIAYHPPIFKPVSRLTAGSIAFDAARDGVAIHAPHTALDAAAGGTNDVLADAVGIDPRARRGVAPPKADRDSSVKLVTFVPEAHADPVADALFSAGAGRIGAYERCSFRTVGEGTFFAPSERTRPVVGQTDRLERVREVRFETVVPLARLDAVLQAHRAAHPYETPAFDLLRLASAPEHPGYGRIGPLTEPAPVATVLARIQRALGVERLLVAGPTEREVRTAAVGAGSTGELLSSVLAQGADLFVLGELRHHDALRAAEAGLTVVMTLHSNSERAALARVRDRLAEALPSLALSLSERDRDPFSFT